MPKGKKPVYNGYEEEYLSGADLKEKFVGSFYTGGRHHESIFTLPIPVLLDLVGVEDNKTYRIFIKPYFCRVMKGDTDGLVFFFGYSDFYNKEQISNNDIIDVTICPICKNKLKLKSGRNGEFIGCSAYPSCKFTKNFTNLKTKPPLADSQEIRAKTILQWNAEHINDKDSISSSPKPYEINSRKQ